MKVEPPVLPLDGAVEVQGIAQPVVGGAAAGKTAGERPPTTTAEKKKDPHS